MLLTTHSIQNLFQGLYKVTILRSGILNTCSVPGTLLTSLPALSPFFRGVHLGPERLDNMLEVIASQWG